MARDYLAELTQRVQLISFLLEKRVPRNMG